MTIPSNITVRTDSQGIARGIVCDGLHGTADQPVLVDGGWAEIDGGGGERTFVARDCSHMLVRKWLLHGAGPNNAVVHCEKCSDVRFERVLAWDAGDGNAMPWLIWKSQRVQLLDCAGWGRGRKVFQWYCSDDCSATRCWGRWGGMKTPQPGSCGVYAPAYNTFRMRMHDCIGQVVTDSPQLVNAVWLADSMDIEPWKDQAPDCVVSRCVAISPLERQAFHIGAKKHVYYERCVRATRAPLTPGSTAGYAADTPSGQRVLRELLDAWSGSPILAQLNNWALADPVRDIEQLIIP